MAFYNHICRCMNVSYNNIWSQRNEMIQNIFYIKPLKCCIVISTFHRCKSKRNVHISQNRMLQTNFIPYIDEYITYKNLIFCRKINS